MLEKLFDILVVEPEINYVVNALGEEGFAIACSTGLKSDGTFCRNQRGKEWEDLQITR